jgi:TPR repeat protein
MYANGKGVEQNYKEAIDWFKKAAEKEHIDAQYSLGLMYYNGEGTEQNYKEAANWYKKAADQGHSQAKAALTKILESK